MKRQNGDGKGPLRAVAAVLAVALLAGCGAGAQTEAPQESADAPPAAAEAGPVHSTAEKLLAQMSLRQKVGQLFIVRPDALEPGLTQKQIDDAQAAGVTALSAGMEETLAKYPVGGVALFGKNIQSPAQLHSFLEAMQQHSETALFTAVDEEGGQVSRLANHPAFDTPQYASAQAVAETGDPAAAREMGTAIGGYLAEHGFNLDFAPVADVNTNPQNSVIGERAFGSDATVAAGMVAAAVEGFHASGVMCCLKHFPGHGDTAQDSHFGCATTEKTWQGLCACELLPFQSGIAAGADMVMVGHITAPGVTGDGLPTSLSREMIEGRLRGELGYDGVVITDSLAMEAITDAYGPGESAVLALQAGADILLMPAGLAEAFDAVLAAVEDGTLSTAHLDESVARVLALKEQYGLL